MASTPIVSWFGRLTQLVQRPIWLRDRPDLHTLGANPALVPPFVQESALARRYLDLLSPLAWDRFPERNLAWQPPPIPYAALAAACLIKLDQQLVSMGRLRQYLVDHPALIWLCGFPVQPAAGYRYGFDPDASLPTARHLTRMLRELPADTLQFLLTSSVALLQAELMPCSVRLGACVSVDTKHIIAWVKENNPKAYVSNRYDKPSSLPATPTVSWAASAAITGVRRVPTNRPRRRHLPITRVPPRRSPSASFIGATRPGSSPPKHPIGASSCWPS